MAKYMYKALDREGIFVQGDIEAESLDAAAKRLEASGYLPVSIKEEKEKFSLSNFFLNLTRIKPDDLIFFTRQLQTVIRSGIPLLSGLSSLEQQTENPLLKKVIGDILKDVDAGKSLSEALKKHPKIFSELYINMVEAGEVSGALDEVLDRLATLLEYDLKTKEDIKSAVRYPIMVIVGMTIAFFVLMTFVIPKFAAIFRQAQIPLPLPTRIMISLSDVISAYWYYVILSFAVFIIILKKAISSTRGRFIWDRIKLKFPILGPILLKIYMSRFAHMLEVLIRSGITITNALEIVAKTVGNAFIESRIFVIKEKIEGGKGIAKPLESSGVFPPLVIHMVATGEESGSLEEMLHEVSLHYDREVDYSIRRLSTWIEPVLTVGLGVMVLFMALAVFMPWWNMISAFKAGAMGK